MNKNLKTATIFFRPGTKRPHCYKYGISQPVKFAHFAANKGAIYINWYDKSTGQFLGRQWLVNDFKK